MTSFSEQIAAFNRKCEKRMRAVARTAVQETIAEAQTPQGRGGRLRIKTGFLRASIAAALGRMPSGESENPGNRQFDWDIDALAPTLLRWDPNTGETLFVGWLASYARAREYHDGFMRGAAENWDANVKKANEEAQRRIP